MKNRYNLTFCFTEKFTRFFISKISVFLIILLLQTTVTIQAQTRPDPETEKQLKKDAENYFVKDDFINAYKLYSQLLSLYPKDPIYNYRFGACILYNTSDKKKAIKYLQYGIKQTGVDNLAYYYLGKAQHLNYEFDDAIASYQKFEQGAGSADLKKYPVAHLIDMCKNGKTLIASSEELDVLRKKQLNLSDFFRAYNMHANGGSLIKEPEEFKSKLDKDKLPNNLMYLTPDKSQAFFSSYGINESNGKDIYVISKKPNGTWGVPQNLGNVINTTYDEDYPVYDAPRNTLYFSSKGHNSMGGYDIFASVYNDTTKTWLEPYNVDFPVNTPDDDILLMPDTSGQTAFFASTRSCPQGKIDVYKIALHLHPPGDIVIAGTVDKAGGTTPAFAIITVRDSATNKIVAIDTTSADDGHYSFNLPKGGKYNFTVEDSTHKGQSQAVTLAMQEAHEGIVQAIQFDASGNLHIKNTTATTPRDSDAKLALQYIQNEAQMNVNVDTNNLQALLAQNKVKSQTIAANSTANNTQIIGNNSTGVSNTTTTGYDTAKITGLENEQQKLNDNASKAIDYAGNEMETAQQLEEKVSNPTDNGGNSDSIAKWKAGSKTATEKGIEAYQLAAGYKTQAAGKQSEINKIENVSANTTQANNQSANITNGNTSTANVSTGDLIRQQAAQVKEDSAQLSQSNIETTQEISGLQQKSEEFTTEAAQTSDPQQKAAYAQQADDLSKSKELKQEEVKENTAELQQLHNENVWLAKQAKQADNNSVATTNTTNSSPELQKEIDAYAISNGADSSEIAANNTSQGNVTATNQNQTSANNNVAINSSRHTKHIRHGKNATQISFSGNIAATNTTANNSTVSNNGNQNTQIASNNNTQVNNNVSGNQNTQSANNNNTSSTNGSNTSANNTQSTNNVTENQNTQTANNNTTSSTNGNNTSANNTQGNNNNVSGNQNTQIANNNTTSSTNVNNTSANNTQGNNNNVSGNQNTQTANNNTTSSTNGNNISANNTQTNNNQTTNQNTQTVSNNTTATNVSTTASETSHPDSTIYYKTSPVISLDSITNTYAKTSTGYSTSQSTNLGFAQTVVEYTDTVTVVLDQKSEKYFAVAKFLTDTVQKLRSEALAEPNKNKAQVIYNKVDSINGLIYQLNLKGDQVIAEADTRQYTINTNVMTGIRAQAPNTQSINIRTAQNLLNDAEESYNQAVSEKESANNTSDLAKKRGYMESAKKDFATAVLKQEDAIHLYIQAESTQTANTTNTTVSNSRNQNTQIASNNNTTSNGNNTAANNTQSNNNVAGNQNTQTANNNTTSSTNGTANSIDNSHSNNNQTANQNTQTSNNTGTSSSNTNNTQTTNIDPPTHIDSSNNTSATSSANTETNNTNTSSANNQSASIPETNTIFNNTRRSAYSAAHPIPVDPTISTGLIFGVQIGAFRNPIPPDLFKGFKPIMGLKTTEGIVRYIAGQFTSFDTAKNAAVQIRSLGYPGAFVVAFYNGKRISLKEALAKLGISIVPVVAIQNTQTNNNTNTSTGTNPVTPDNTNTTSSANQGAATIAANTIAPSEENLISTKRKTIRAIKDSVPPEATPISEIKGLLFTVQVGSFSTHKGFTRLRKIKHLYSWADDKGTIKYNSGTFSSIGDARAAKDIIVANTVVKDAFVTAYYNGRRITIAEAKSLLGNVTQPTNIVSPVNTNLVTPANTNSVTPTDNNSSATAPTYKEVDSSSFAIASQTRIIYTVRITSFNGPVPIDTVSRLLAFANEGIEPYKEESGATAYYAGKFPDYAEATILQKKFYSGGFGKATIIAYNHGKKISTKEALSITNK